MKISLNKRKLKDGRLSLSIEYYKGSEINENGKRRHLRNFENLDSYLLSDPKTAKEKKENKEVLEFAENVLAIRKAEFVQGKFDLKSTTKSKRTFLKYFEELTEEKQKRDSSNNYGNWYSTLQHLNNVISKNVTFDDIDESFVKKVRTYF
ncbi:MAG: phage integrase SAM-like domain-containing protein, partial [Sphingobacterium sp.]